MNYLPERGGLGAFPDDPARVSAPMGLTDQQEREYDRNRAIVSDSNFVDVYDSVMAVLRGTRQTARIGTDIYDAGELFEAITESEESTDLAPMLLGRGMHRLIENWCGQQADRLTRQQLGEPA